MSSASSMDACTSINGRLESSSDVREPLPNDTKAVTNEIKNDQIKEVKEESFDLQALVDAHPFLVLSLKNCPQCEELKEMLVARGVPDEVFVKFDKADPLYPLQKKAVQAYAGEVFTFPQVFSQGVHQGGFQAAAELLRSGAFDDVLEREYQVEPTTIQNWTKKQSMAIFALPNCSQCHTLSEDLKKRGVPVQDVFIKLDKAKPEYNTLKAQLQKLINKEKFLYPQTFVEGVYQGNYDEVIRKADQGSYADFFSRTFGLEPPAPTMFNEPAGGGEIKFDEDF